MESSAQYNVVILDIFRCDWAAEAETLRPSTIRSLHMVIWLISMSNLRKLTYYSWRILFLLWLTQFQNMDCCGPRLPPLFQFDGISKTSSNAEQISRLIVMYSPHGFELLNDRSLIVHVGYGEHLFDRRAFMSHQLQSYYRLTTTIEADDSRQDIRSSIATECQATRHKNIFSSHLWRLQ